MVQLRKIIQLLLDIWNREPRNMRHVLVCFISLLVCSGGLCQHLTMTQHIISYFISNICHHCFSLLLHLLPDLKYPRLIGTVHLISCEWEHSQLFSCDNRAGIPADNPCHNKVGKKCMLLKKKVQWELSGSVHCVCIQRKKEKKWSVNMLV